MKTIENWDTKQLFVRMYQPLQEWLKEYGIEYPWSDAGAVPDSYAVWVSEVMLQQTRVETVRPYFRNWLERWPTLGELARAKEEEVLRQWEGLGYYNRALNMLKCAEKCIHELGLDNLPRVSAELLALPGIGPYIAAAVASISGNEAVLALDTNVRRIFSRLYQRQPGPVVEREWQRRHSLALEFCIWRGRGNVALIQLGQQLCKAKRPLCSRCPLQGFCPTARSSNWAEFPVRKVFRKQKSESRRLLLWAEGGYLLLRKRSGHLRHLWRFPECEQLGTLFAREEDGTYLGSFCHAYLQEEEKIQVFRHVSPISRNDLEAALSQTVKRDFEWTWAGLTELEQLTLAGPYRRFLRKFLHKLCESPDRPPGQQEDGSLHK
ncbi:hypothetical protein P0082_01535 [Candidatus Haliotispira prima]|uniref:Adenine DNA glycosylase n=1 Tax=Candidatus Haliotispira prima TaxID=3034016 RepID=A0ABY8MK40_9SPIO|nr:hypothetical protein P0082_01535 [Candidatus Haliotispira prima]